MTKSVTTIFVDFTDGIESLRRLLPIEYRRECWVVARGSYSLLVTPLPLRQSKEMQEIVSEYSDYLARQVSGGLKLSEAY